MSHTVCSHNVWHIHSIYFYSRITQDDDVDAVSDDLFTMTSRKNDKNGAVITSNDDVVLGRDQRTLGCQGTNFPA